MRNVFIYCMLLAVSFFTMKMSAQETFPDGSPITKWFYETETVNVNKLGKKYKLTDHGVVNDSTILQTEEIQAVIDKAAAAGGGVIIVPKGVFLSGSIFFKPNTHLHLEEGAKIKGSDDISDFPVVTTRIEGQTVKYFPALVNADKVDGFTLSGKGTLDGNEERYWKAFWLRREWNPKCTNMDEMRPRVLYVSNSNDVQISGVNLINSPFWTSHYYKCDNLKILGVTFTAPKEPVRAPSSDAIDIDVCTNVLIKDCYVSVNDDGIALKGGKGPFADKDEDNGANKNVIIEDCTFGFCHSVLTCGSESIHNRNIILRRSTAEDATRLLHLKMRGDTPQNYEHILLEDLTGSVDYFLFVRPWTQFFDLKGLETPPHSYSHNITFRNIDMSCKTFFSVVNSDQYTLSDFTFDNLKIKADDPEVKGNHIKNFSLKDVVVNGKVVEAVTPELKNDIVSRPDRILSGSTRKGSNPVLFLIGDSTMKNGKGKGDNGQWGWGSFFEQFFDTTRITVENHALGGRSSRTFITEGLWGNVLPGIKEGDYLIIQFGHNDGGPFDTGRARASIKGIGDESKVFIMEKTGDPEEVFTFGHYIRRYIREAKAKGAIPIVLSHTPGNTWEDGKMVRNNETYGKWSKEIAEQENVLFIDMNDLSASKCESIGQEKTNELFKDRVHSSFEGAMLNCEVLIEGMKDIKDFPLNDFIK